MLTTYLNGHDLRHSLDRAYQPARKPRRCCPAATLEQIKGVDPLIALAVRKRWKDTGNTRSYCRKKVDELIGTCGVEYLGAHKRTGLDVYYCNAGDPYATTVIFHGDNLQVGCWGDLVERGLIDNGEDN